MNKIKNRQVGTLLYIKLLNMIKNDSNYIVLYFQAFLITKKYFIMQYLRLMEAHI